MRNPQPICEVCRPRASPCDAVRGVSDGTPVALAECHGGYLMLKRIVILSALVCGVAAAQPKTDVDYKAKHAEMKAKMLERFDANKDGKLDEAERKVMRDVRASELFKRLDTDGNGVLSLDEFKAAKQFGKH